MKTNHRRKNKGKFLTGHNYSVLNYQAMFRAGCSPEHDGGHRGAAKDRREIKTIRSRRRRRVMNRAPIDVTE